MSSVAIIGAGITGLTAAFYLKRKGIPVTVYESSGRVGGVIQSVQRDGYLAEFGPNTILETSPKIGQLVRDAGLASRRRDPDPQAEARYVVRYRRPIEMPGSPMGFLTTELFSAKAKLAVLREPFVPPRRDGKEESIAEFVVRRLGQEFLDHAIDALVAGVYAGDPYKLSVPQAFPKLKQLEDRYGSLIKGQILGARERKKRGEVAKDRAPKFSFDQGLQVLPETLAEHLGEDVRLNTSVCRVAQRQGGWTLLLREQGEDLSAEHTAILYCGTAHKLAELRLETPISLRLDLFSEIRYPPVASVVLGFRREDVAHPCQGFGMLIPRVEGFKILGTIFSSALFPNRAPSGHLTLTSYVGGERFPELASRSPEELFALTCEDLRVLLGVRGKPTFQHSVFYPKAIPQYVVGYGRYRELMNEIETKAPGLFLAGHFRDGISLSDSIVSACNAADRVGAFCRESTPAMTVETRGCRMSKGVLMVNLGSPDSPSVSDVRRYLREFLMDGRVLDINWPQRFALVNFAILPFRPKNAAHAYRKIWLPEGSPLVAISRNVRQRLQSRVSIPVELAMRYQNPSITSAVRSLAQQGADEILLIPLFPHYAMSSFETAVERVKEVAAELAPGTRIVVQPPFYNHPQYIGALVASAQDHLNRGYDHLLFSFHGLPERQIRKSDPTGCHCLASATCCEGTSAAHATCYRAQCFKTVEAFVKLAGVPTAKYSVAFQSRLGRDPWLKPYTDYELVRFAAEGKKSLLVICPAFVSDCLETLEEIGIRGRETFMNAGGSEFDQIPCLNEHPLWLEALEGMVSNFAPAASKQSLNAAAKG